MASRRATATRRPSPLIGRDEITLADFPLSVAKRQQPRLENGEKVFKYTFPSHYWSNRTQQWEPQQVTLKTNSEDGLPTSTDVQLLVAFMYLSHRLHGFAASGVPFLIGIRLGVLAGLSFGINLGA